MLKVIECVQALSLLVFWVSLPFEHDKNGSFLVYVCTAHIAKNIFAVPIQNVLDGLNGSWEQYGC